MSTKQTAMQDERESEVEVLDEEIDGILDNIIDSKGLTLSGDKNENLNDQGRRSLDFAGATLDRSSEVLADLLHSKNDKTRFQAAKFIHERHAGRLSDSKDESKAGINVLILNKDGNPFDGILDMLNPRPMKQVN